MSAVVPLRDSSTGVTIGCSCLLLMLHRTPSLSSYFYFRLHLIVVSLLSWLAATLAITNLVCV